MPALGLDFERSLRAQPSDVRKAVSTALRETGFQLTAEQLTRVEAKRGSRLLGGALMPARMMPIIAWFDITADTGGCTLAGHFADQHLNLGGKAWGWNQTYRQLFGEVLAAIDSGLARLDPGAAGSFAPARFWSKGGDIAVLEQAQSAGSQAGAAVLGKANEVLEGGPRDRGPAAWKGVDSVTFGATKGYAVLSLAETQGHLGIGMIIASQPGSLPPNLQREVEQFAGRVEETLTNAPGRAVTISVADPELPVFEFLHQQVRVRNGLPVRTLHTCRTCRFQRVTNVDFTRLQARNQRLRSLVGGVGATISSGGIQPFVIFGQLFKLKKLDPDYVCPRCQGLGADERVVTFCPSCGDMRSEAVLRACGKCNFDFRKALAGETLWLTAEAAAALVAPPADTGPAWPAAEPAVAAGWAATPAPGGTWVGPAPEPPAGPSWGASPAPDPPAGPSWGASPAPAERPRPPWAGRVGERFRLPWPARSGERPRPPWVAGESPGASWGASQAPVAGPTWGTGLPPTGTGGGTELPVALGAPIQTPGAGAQLPTPGAGAQPTGAPTGAPAPGPMSFCPFCGTRAGPEYAFCPTCGARLDATTLNPGGPTG